MTDRIVTGFEFLSTLSLRRATPSSGAPRLSAMHFYPRSPCGERRAGRWRSGQVWYISIHALLAESDFPQQSSRPRAALFLSTLSLRRATFTCGASTNNVNISIHALLAESDQSGNPSWIPFQQFLSTLSLRRATLPPHKQKRRNWISIHALLAESDLSMPSGNTNSLNFYPRSPCGERPCQQPVVICVFRISIHALLAESDHRSHGGSNHGKHFYPRSPCGERLLGAVTSPAVIKFLSTLSLRRATAIIVDNSRLPIFLSTLSLRRATRAANCQQRNHQISIHALLAESDSRAKTIAAKIGDFYPRSPCGERLYPVQD